MRCSSSTTRSSPPSICALTSGDHRATLVITGEDDFITGPVCAADFASIRDQTTVVLPGCGHFIFVEARDGFRDEVAAFLMS
jgi:pimeloyl-ACP methyl ester carboxylesterase